VAWPTRSPDLNPLHFFLQGSIKSTAHLGDKPEERHQLVVTIDEAADGIRNELARMQWQHSMAQGLAACMQSNGGHLKHVL
jgi:hypothetical protein